MLEILSKPLEEITPADLQALIDSEVPEGEQIEFKREPPARNGGRDRWMTSGDDIGNYAKNTILEGVTAFANAYGGVFLIGIEESKTKPSVATKISPVPQCADLADRFRKIFRDGVDPQLTRIEIRGIPTEGGSGVVILRVGGRSRLAPHRVKKTLVCPIRRGDECRKMSMREIQDMTLNVSRGLERLDKRLSKRSKRFKKEFDRLSNPQSALGIRFTAVPVVDEIGFDRVFQQGRIVNDLDMPWGKVKVAEENQNGQRELENTILAFWPSSWPPSFWRPLLRGARATTSYDANTPDPSSLPYRSGYQEIYCDGLLELGYLSITDENDKSSFLLDPDWPIVMFANLAVWADHVRNQAGAPTVEYALEVETYNRGNAGFVGKDRYFKRNPKLPNEKFPRYPLNDPDEITELLARFHRDFWNSIGLDSDNANFILG